MWPSIFQAIFVLWFCNEKSIIAPADALRSVSSRVSRVVPQSNLRFHHPLKAKKSWQLDDPQENESGFAYSLELPKTAGLNWGSDISFRWIYVLDLDPNGAAAESGMIKKASEFFCANGII